MSFLGDEAWNEWLYIHGGLFCKRPLPTQGWGVGFEACLLFPDYSISGYSTGPVNADWKKTLCSLKKFYFTK